MGSARPPLLTGRERWGAGRAASFNKSVGGLLLFLFLLHLGFLGLVRGAFMLLAASGVLLSLRLRVAGAAAAATAGIGGAAVAMPWFVSSACPWLAWSFKGTVLGVSHLTCASWFLRTSVHGCGQVELHGDGHSGGSGSGGLGSAWGRGWGRSTHPSQEFCKVPPSRPLYPSALWS